MTEIQLCILIRLVSNKYIPQEVLGKIKDKSMPKNMFRIKDDDSTM